MEKNFKNPQPVADSSGGPTNVAADGTRSSEKFVVCNKCKKRLPEGESVAFKNEVLCKECYDKILKRQKQVKIVGGLIVISCLCGLGLYFGLSKGSSNVKGFGGNTVISDSMNITTDSVSQSFSMENTTAISASVEADGVATNLDAFQTTLTASVHTAQQNASSEVVIPSVGLLFEFNKAQLNDTSKALLKAFAAAYLKTNKKAHIHISGYTCDLGTSTINNIVSKERAQVVRDFLLQEGISAEVLDVAWFGKEKYSTFNYPSKSDYRRVVVEIK